MKFLLVALSLIAVCSAGLVGYSPYSAWPLGAPLGAPWPLAYSAPAPLTWAHQPLVVAAAPVVQPGYVAATRGSLHVAPLPGDTPYASHHLNLAPAPGTV